MISKAKLEELRDIEHVEFHDAPCGPTEWLEILDTISTLYQENEELKKIKGLCGPGGCAHLPPNHYEALLAVAKAAEDAINCPQFLCDDLDRANLESALAVLREGEK